MRRLMNVTEIDVQLPQARPSFAARLLDHFTRFRIAHATDGRPACLDDARFLEGDFRQRVAEHLHVIEADAGDNRDERLADVGRIETPAEANLDHGEIDLAANEVKEAEGGADFEERQLALELW